MEISSLSFFRGSVYTYTHEVEPPPSQACDWFSIFEEGLRLVWLIWFVPSKQCVQGLNQIPCFKFFFSRVYTLPCLGIPHLSVAYLLFVTPAYMHRVLCCRTTACCVQKNVYPDTSPATKYVIVDSTNNERTQWFLAKNNTCLQSNAPMKTTAARLSFLNQLKDKQQPMMLEAPEELGIRESKNNTR